jgi:non-canonical poly(A) RNA polymerase PAPD5/7
MRPHFLTCSRFLHRSHTALPRQLLGPLSRQIEQFSNLVALNDKESHEQALHFLSAQCHKLAPKSKLCVFGSYATGLALEDSDIDVNVQTDQGFVFLQRLHKYVQSHVHEAELIRAKVPICRIRMHNGIQLDVNCAEDDGQATVKVIQDYSQQYPQFRPLFFVLKTILVQFGLNQLFTGGLSSISLQYMILTFLQLTKDEKNIGELLRDFFLFYGIKVVYKRMAIDVRRAKIVSYKGSQRVHMCIRDPCRAGNNLAAGTHRIDEVEELFKKGYQYLNSGQRCTLTGLFAHLYQL